eukprot:1361750-Pyramimonas_sp.AAC.1
MAAGHGSADLWGGEVLTQKPPTRKGEGAVTWQPGLYIPHPLDKGDLFDRPTLFAPDPVMDAREAAWHQYLKSIKK